MPNLLSALKGEISRIARKELREELAGLKRAVVAYRSEIASLKRRALVLEQSVRSLQKDRPKTVSVVAEAAASHAARFSAKGLVSQRRRLGLSASDCGLLVGASGQSVYNWEDGKVRPQARHLAAIAAFRTLGKKDAVARLAALRRLPKQ